jgi:hypothetical protein
VQVPPVVDMSRDELVGWLGPTIQRYLINQSPQRKIGK